MKKREGGHHFNVDRPILRKKEDEFSRFPFAKRLAEILSKRKDPSSFVVGVYGEWGEGKTSVLNLMYGVLLKSPNLAILKFNPWHFVSLEDLAAGFFEALAKKLESTLTTKGEQITKAIQEYAGIFKINLPLIPLSVNPGDIPKRKPSLNQLKDRIEKILEESGVTTVVLIDDIDRLDTEEIRLMFKLVKLSANFKNVVYVVFFDHELVAQSLARIYPGEHESGGKRFLEKIIQVPLRMPAAPQNRLRSYIFNGLQEVLEVSGISLTNEQLIDFVRKFENLIPDIATPRHAKRYNNAVLFSLPLLKGEVNPVDHLLIEAIRILYPVLYQGIQKNQDEVLERSILGMRKEGETKKLIDRLFNSQPTITGEQKDRILEVLEYLFPQIEAGSRGGNREEAWATEKRICSHLYFSRYFNYTVANEDISDIEIEEFIGISANATQSELNAKLKNLIKKSSDVLLQKLSLNIRAIPQASAQKILFGLARHSELWQKNENDFDFATVWGRAISLCANLTKKTEPSLREETISEVIETTKDLLFAINFFMRVMRHEKEPESEQLIPKESDSRLGLVMAKRIAKDSARKPLYLIYPWEFGQILFMWDKYDSPAARKWLTKEFEKNKEVVVKFLYALTPTAYGSYGKSKSDFRQDAYDLATKIIPADLIAKRIERLFSGKLQPSEFRYPGTGDISEELRIANQFMFLYQENELRKKDK